MKPNPSNTRIFKLLVVLALFFALGACSPSYVKQTLTGQGGVYYLDSAQGKFPQFPAPPQPDASVETPERFTPLRRQSGKP
jgi:hypothetical protein